MTYRIEIQPSEQKLRDVWRWICIETSIFSQVTLIYITFFFAVMKRRSYSSVSKNMNQRCSCVIVEA
ncbi:hypothetical protein EUGRSUZ_B04036 [Eucalyptus grandis]|uniref:Uncharacterized protein n=2 Tax=Eucalyptus grandis TaxID=71139 RepID=A0ACC3LYP6_EUCGR|nr:hypothetical protein EUGRSUZ_B04036 [Eucalyptus grandis]